MVIRRGRPEGKGIEATIASGLTSQQNIRPNGRLYASIVGFCSRKGMLSATNEESQIISASSVVYMRMGEEMENIVIDSLYKKRVLLFKQYNLPNIGLNLGGKVDAIVLDNNKVRAVEIKSCGQIPTQQKPGHRQQALLYEAVSGLPSSVLYFSRTVADYHGQLKLKNIPSNPTDRELQMVIYNAAYAHEAIQMGVVPPKPALSEQDCKFCPFIDFCYHGREIEGKQVATPDQHYELSQIALERTTEIMDPDAVRERRIGVIKFLSENGNNHARKLFENTDWEQFID